MAMYMTLYSKCCVLTFFQTYVVKYQIYSMYTSAYHKGVIFVLAPVQSDKGSGRFHVFLYLFNACTGFA